MAQRYCSQVYFKPSQELQTEDIQLSLEGFVRVTCLREVRKILSSPIAQNLLSACLLGDH